MVQAQKTTESVNIKTKRMLAAKKAEILVKEQLGYKCKSNTFYLLLHADRPRYQQEVQCFKLLFRQNDSDYRLALWNAIDTACFPDSADFDDEEIQFIYARKNACNKWKYATVENINAPFCSRRLRFRSVLDEDMALLRDYMERDNDVSNFICLEPTKNNLRRFDIQMPLFFVIEDSKSKNVVGYIGLSFLGPMHEKTGVASLACYICKPFRRKGYAKEAVTAICKKAISRELCLMRESIFECAYAKSAANIHVIRAGIRTDDIAAQSLVTGCGFQYCGTLHREYWLEESGCVDQDIYEFYDKD